MKKIKDVEALPDYELKISYENGEQGVLDMKPYLDFGIFSRLADPEAFSKVRISFDTIEWACGPDLDPEFVREHTLLVPVSG